MNTDIAYACGVCGAVFLGEQSIRNHTSKRDERGEQHDGEPWSVVWRQDRGSMTEDDLAALLRADPQRAVAAIEKAKVAGPWTPFSGGRSIRCGWSSHLPIGEGLRNAATDNAKHWHDEDLKRLGWVLA